MTSVEERQSGAPAIVLVRVEEDPESLRARDRTVDIYQQTFGDRHFQRRRGGP